MISILHQLGKTPENFIWQDLASCQGMDTNDFFEGYEKAKTFEKRYEILRRCRLCPVRKQCLDFGISNKEEGIFGGVYLSPNSVKAKLNEHLSEEELEELNERIANR